MDCPGSGLWDQRVSPVIRGNPPLHKENSLWEALSVVSQKWVPFPTALPWVYGDECIASRAMQHSARNPGHLELAGLLHLFFSFFCSDERLVVSFFFYVMVFGVRHVWYFGFPSNVCVKHVICCMCCICLDFNSPFGIIMFAVSTK